MSTPDFVQLTTPTALGDGRYAIDIPDGWQQGRGLFGGFVMALLARAIRAEEDEAGRALRSLTAELPGPTQPGRAELRVEVLRRGNGVTTTAVRLLQGGELMAHAVGVLGRTRVQDRDQVQLTPPALTRWQDVPVAPVRPPLGPVFAQHCEFRPVGNLPFSGSTADPVAQGWFRLRAPGATWDEAEVVAVIDGYWPALLTSEPMPRPVVTLAFTFQALRPAHTLDRSAPLFHRARTLAASDGYLVEQRELWTPAGELVALNQQTMAIVK